MAASVGEGTPNSAPDSSLGWILLAVALGLGGSALFTVLHYALFALDSDEILQLRRSDPSGAQLLQRLRTDLDHTWVALMTGAILFNLLLALSIRSVLLNMSNHRGLAPSVMAAVVAIAAVLVLGEVLPGLLAARSLKTLAPLSSRCIRVWRFLLVPISAPPLAVLRFFGRISGVNAEDRRRALEVEKRLLVLVGLGKVDVTLEEEEREMIDHALEFGQKTAGEIMTPRDKIAGSDTSASQDEVLRMMRETPRTRVVVYDGSLDHVEGVLHTKKILLHPHIDYHRFIDAPLFVPEDMDLIDLMALMKRQRCHIVVVLDHLGLAIGLVSMHDLLEALVGEIPEQEEILAQRKVS